MKYFSNGTQFFFHHTVQITKMHSHTMWKLRKFRQITYLQGCRGDFEIFVFWVFLWTAATFDHQNTSKECIRLSLKLSGWINDSNLNPGLRMASDFYRVLETKLLNFCVCAGFFTNLVWLKFNHAYDLSFAP